MASRDTLEAEAVTLGLAGAATYQNKKVVEKAIERVKNGENAAEVDNEYQLAPNDEDHADGNAPADDAGVVAPVETTDEPTGDDENTDDDDAADDADVTDEPTTDDANDTPDAAPASRAPRPKSSHRNQGHPSSFDEFGAPRF